MNSLKGPAVHSIFGGCGVLRSGERDEAKLFALAGDLVAHDAGRDDVAKAFESLEEVLAADVGVQVLQEEIAPEFV